MFDFGDDLEKAEGTGQGQYLQKDEVGDYLLELDNVEMKDSSRNAPMGGMLARFKVLESNNPKVTVGSVRDINFWRHNEGASDRALRFFFALLPGTSKDQIVGLARYLSSSNEQSKAQAQNFLKGRRVYVSAFVGPSKKTGIDIVKTNFRAAPATTAA